MGPRIGKIQGEQGVGYRMAGYSEKDIGGRWERYRMDERVDREEEGAGWGRGGREMEWEGRGRE